MTIKIKTSTGWKTVSGGGGGTSGDIAFSQLKNGLVSDSPKLKEALALKQKKATYSGTTITFGDN